MLHQNYPDFLFNPETTHMLTIAHQDDEIFYTSLIKRWGDKARFVWVTNGDGLAPAVNADPKEYAEIRKTETDNVLKILDRKLEDRICLDYSEIEIYSNFVELTLNPANKESVMNFMYKIGCDIYREVKQYQPDVVWTSQYQNGHPEHDLTHMLTAYAIRQVIKEDKKEIKFYQLPEYEYTILIPMRFHPLYKGVVHHIEITDEEMALKRKAMECYPSQTELFVKFEKVISYIGKLGKLIGKGFEAEDFIKTEYFGPVDGNQDYSKSYHKFEWANYMFDKHKDIKVRFDKHLAVIATELKDRAFTL